MTNETFYNFFSNIDWEMLTIQRNNLIRVRNEIVRSKKRKNVLKRIIKLIDFWFEYKNKTVEWKFPTINVKSFVLLRKRNWEQLKADKLEYLYIQQLKSLTSDQWLAMEGILNGIDCFQDAAVNELKLDKNEVFTLIQDDL